LEVDYIVDAKPSRIRNFAANLPALKNLRISMLPSKKPPAVLRHADQYKQELDLLSLHQDQGTQNAPFLYLMMLFPFYKRLLLHAVYMARP